MTQYYPKSLHLRAVDAVAEIFTKDEPVGSAGFAKVYEDGMGPWQEYGCSELWYGAMANKHGTCHKSVDILTKKASRTGVPNWKTKPTEVS